MKKWIVEIIDLVLLIEVIVCIFKQKQIAASQCAFLVFTWFVIGIIIGFKLGIKITGERLRTYFCYILMCLSTFCLRRKWLKASTFFFRRFVDLMDQEQKAQTLRELLLAECRLMVKYPHLMDEYIERNYETEKTNHEAMMKKAQGAADGGSSEGL